MDVAATQMPDAEPAPDDLRATIAYVRELQRDGRLLLRHVARQGDRGVAGVPGLGPEQVSVLTEAPSQVARATARFASLAAWVDMLSRQSAPANASTIRLTQAYLRPAPEGGEPSAEVRSRVTPLRWIVKALVGMTVLAIVVTLSLLAHVDSGRRAVQQLQTNIAERDGITGELAKLPRTAWVEPRVPSREGAYRSLCPQEDGTGMVPADNAEGARAEALCIALGENIVRSELTMMRLSRWNRLSCGLPLLDPCTAPEGSPIYGVPRQTHWERTEVRTAAVISTLTGFVLPLLLGFIGGCAYVLRRLDQRLSENTLEVRDGGHAALRVLLATMLGGLLGVVWSGDQPMQLGGFALTLAAAAFFVGFALEAVFTVIEAMVEGVAGKLRSPAPLGPSVLAPRPAPSPGAGGG